MPQTSFKPATDAHESERKYTKLLYMEALKEHPDTQKHSIQEPRRSNEKVDDEISIAQHTLTITEMCDDLSTLYERLFLLVLNGIEPDAQ